MSVRYDTIPLLTKRKVATNMLISEALVGKAYYSKSRPLSGIIQYAEKRDNVYTRKNVFAYSIKVRPTWNGQGIPKPDFFATIYVGVDE